MRRELKQVALVFDTTLVHLSDVKQVRWLASKIRAVEAFQICFPTIVNHLGAVATGTSEQSAKAKGWLRKILTVSYIQVVHILQDVLPILTDVSLMFQAENLLIIDVPRQLEGLMRRLMNLKLDRLHGKNMNRFSQMYNHETSSCDGK